MQTNSLCPAKVTEFKTVKHHEDGILSIFIAFCYWTNRFCDIHELGVFVVFYWLGHG